MRVAGVTARMLLAEVAPAPYTMDGQRRVAAARATTRCIEKPSALTRMLEADRLAVALAAARDRLSLPLARAAGALVRRRAWVLFGYARLDDFARECLGRSGRWVRDLAALSGALESLPALVDALTGDDGGRPLGRVAALQIGRAAAIETVEAWIAYARQVTVRELSEAVRRARATGCAGPTLLRPAVECRLPAEAAEAAEEDDEERCLVRLLVPHAVRATFEEALDLYRALVGQEASLTSFVEALVGEALAGPCAPDVDAVPLKLGMDASLVERALGRASENWRWLAGPPAAAKALEQAGLTLERVAELTRRSGQGDAIELEQQVRELSLLEEEIERRLGAVLAAMSRRGAWARLLFAGIGHYGEQRLGLSRSSAQDRAGLARALGQLPLLRRAYEQGRIGFAAALLIRRMLGQGPVDPGLEQAWVERAQEATIKRLRDEARRLGRLQAAEPETAALPAGDDEWFASLRRAPGMALERVQRLGQAASEVVFPDVFLRLRLPKDLAGDLVAAVEAARAALTAQVEQVAWYEPWPQAQAQARFSLLSARTFSIRCRRVPAWVGLLWLIEDFVLTWDDPHLHQAKRASDPIYIRDGWRCTAPGCTGRRNLEAHHIRYRSQGRDDSASNRTCLCRFHHQLGEHGELACCRGAAPLGIAWQLGRDGIGGNFKNERRTNRNPLETA